MRHKHGGDIYTNEGVTDFSANINFVGMPENVRTAAHEGVEKSIHYPDPDCRSLRLALAKRENRLYDTHVRMRQILCGNGAAELVFALVAAYRPTDALLAEPCFYEYEQALEAYGVDVQKHFLRARENFALGRGFQKAAAEFALSLDSPDKRGMIFLANPNNPTGRLIDQELLDALLTLCHNKNILLVLDESFFDFLSGEDKKKTFSGVLKVQENPELFVLRSFTKIYALPGIRFGYGISGSWQLLSQMRNILQPWNVSVVAQDAARAAATETAFAGNSAKWIAVYREEMKKALKSYGYRVFPSNANFLLFAGPDDLEEYCLKHNFLIRACDNFQGLESAGDGLSYYRICVRSREENEELLALLRKRMEKK